jgi:hypothetical protein
MINTLRQHATGSTFAPHRLAMRISSALRVLLVTVPGLVACADSAAPAAEEGGDLPLGDVSASDSKADGLWGAALDCKPVPTMPQLVNPKITLSINGLSLHLTDDAGFDKVYPVGPGAIDADPISPSFRESLSYYPLIATGGSDFAITPASIQPCKTWWTDPVTGEKRPVFAGLPFMSFYNGYAIHGPIDNFRAANGGALRRGFVSHGCFRMEAADVLEVYARIKGVAKVPVHVQREAERRVDRTKVDLANRWIGAECQADGDCGFTGGFCAKNPLSTRGFCSAHCTTTCADRPGQPATFCVADPNAAGKGMCVPKAQPEDFECRPYDHFVPSLRSRPTQPAVTATVCAPGSPGWVGDHCAADADCKGGTVCRGATATLPGVCSMPCDRFCADQPGYADTFCAAVPSLATGGSCLRQCTPSSNAAECPADMTCGGAPRNGQPGVVKSVCLPAR